MKPLILILFVVTSAQAQNIADAARQERARQSQLKSTRVFSDANTHVVKPITPADPPTAPVAGSTLTSTTAKGSAAAGPAGAALNAAAAAATVDPKAEEMQKLRIRVRALEDQETTLKLQISDITNQVYSPQTDSATHNEALTRLGETQVKLVDVQKELAQARSGLQLLEIQSANKK
jgi:D-Tyr-tRNAtyr deacylase